MHTILHILHTLAAEFGLDPRLITGRRRTRHIAEVRHLVIYAARKLTRFSLAEIGDAVGGRDHCTIIHSLRAADRILRHEPDLRARYQRALASLHQPTP
jgi:chromosomal replication initiator protein